MGFLGTSKAHEIGDGEEHFIAITGSQQPYIFDVPHLLSLPAGFEFRFRYRHQWIEESLWRRIRDDAKSLVGKPLTILFHSQDSKRIIPLRKGEIFSAEEVGPMIFLRFRVGDFPKVDLDVATLSEQRSEFLDKASRQLNRAVADWIGPIAGDASFDLGNPLPSGWYFRRALTSRPKIAWQPGGDSRAWAALASILQLERGLAGVPMFYLLGFFKDSGERTRPAHR